MNRKNLSRTFLLLSSILMIALFTVPAAAQGELLRLFDPDGGRLVMPVGDLEHQELVVLERHGDEYEERRTEPVVFVPLIGEHGFRG